MSSAKPVFWHQGLFLQPQHFQQFELYVQSLLAPLRTYQHPYSWGVCRLQVQEAALKNQLFELSSGELIFQDGTRVSYPENTVIIPRPLELDELEPGKPFKVYLGLRKLNQSAQNVTELDSSDSLGSVSTRFITRKDPAELPDIHIGGPAGHVRQLSYALRMFREEEIEEAADYHLLPVAELEYDGNEIRLGRNFIAPTPTISSSDVLRQIVQNVREQVTSRCRKLEQYKNPRGIQLQEVDTGYILYLLALRTLNRYTSRLHHLAGFADLHPWDFYELMGQLIGELSTFTDRIDALGRLADGTELLPSYDHLNLRNCFEEAMTLLGELLSTLSFGPESIITLQREEGYFKAQIPAEILGGHRLYYLILRTAESPERLLEAIRNVIKISSIEYMSTLISRALPGLAMEHQPTVPPGLPSRPNSFYFELDQEQDLWLDIQKNQSICLFWDQAPKDTKVQLVVLRR